MVEKPSKCNRRWFHSRFVKAPGLAVLLLTGLAASGLAQEKPQPPTDLFAGFPDLIGGLKATPGCLGVETAKTGSGRNVIFAWFENKKALLQWYYSETHQKAMKLGFPNREPGKPLAGVPDNVGPILVITSLTLADKPHFEETPMPISQLSIELYRPLSGGIFLGARFAPEALKVPRMRDFTAKKEEPE